MKCPNCKEENAYIGFKDVECVNSVCPNYDKKHYDRVFSYKNVEKVLDETETKEMDGASNGRYSRF